MSTWVPIDTIQEHSEKRREIDRLIEQALGSHEMYSDSLLSAILIELRRVVDYITLPEEK